MTAMDIVANDMATYIAIGFSWSVILSFSGWAVMKLWRFVVDIIKLSTSFR